MEKAYKAWSSELSNELNMLEADMPRFIRFDKPDFTGKAATLALRRWRCQNRLRELARPQAPDARGGEVPVLIGDRCCIGVVTSGAYGHPGQEKPGIRLRAAGTRHARRRVRSAHSRRAARRDCARRRGLRS